MIKNIIIQLGGFCLFYTLSPFLFSDDAQSQSSSSSPNVILILADDLGWGDLSCYPQNAALPGAVNPTPHLDQMATEGVRFTQAYATACVCAPSRAGLMTGRYQQKFGWYEFKEALAGIPASEKTMAQCLKEKGYATGIFGKWHLGFTPELGPLNKGFDRFFGFLGGQHDYYDARLGEPTLAFSFDYDADILDQNTPVKNINYLTNDFTVKTMDFIKNEVQAKRPFFAYLAYSCPHPPLQAPWENLEPYSHNGHFTSRDIVRAMVNVMDNDIGKIQDLLKSLNIDQNTLVIFTSDNGGADDTWAGVPVQGGQGLCQYNGGLRPRKGFFWEGGIREPMIIRWPGKIPAGGIFTTPASHLDLFPTIMSVAGFTSPAKDGLDGIDLLPYLKAEKQDLPARDLFWGSEEKRNCWAVRRGNWKLTRDIVDGAAERSKPVRYVMELHDLDKDPYEKRDVAADNPSVVAELLAAKDTFYKTALPSIATPALMQANKQDVAQRRLKVNPDSLRRDGAPGHWTGRGAKVQGLAD